MPATFDRTASMTGLLLLIAAITQTIYTALYISEMDVPRQLLWGAEALIFVLMAAFAGSALAQTNAQHLGWSAIFAAAILNVVQVGVGLTMFGPFFEAAGVNESLTPAAQSVVAFSFMVYNAAKVLLALALIVFGAALFGSGAKALGGLSIAVGGIAMAANTASMAMGREVTGEIPLAGGAGVLATVVLAVCLMGLKPDQQGLRSGKSSSGMSNRMHNIPRDCCTDT